MLPQKRPYAELSPVPEDYDSSKENNHNDMTNRPPIAEPTRNDFQQQWDFQQPGPMRIFGSQPYSSIETKFESPALSFSYKGPREDLAMVLQKYLEAMHLINTEHRKNQIT